MTDEEERQFNLYGCVSRSIIKAAELAGKRISRDDFVKRFASHFPKDMFGLLHVDGLCSIMKDLGLASYVNAIRNTEKLLPLIASDQSWRIFVLTDKAPNGGDLFHCSLALNLVAQGTGKPPSGTSPPKPTHIELFSPMQDGSDHDLLVSLADLEEQLCHFLIARP